MQHPRPLPDAVPQYCNQLQAAVIVATFILNLHCSRFHEEEELVIVANLTFHRNRQRERHDNIIIVVVYPAGNIVQPWNKYHEEVPSSPHLELPLLRSPPHLHHPLPLPPLPLPIAATATRNQSSSVSPSKAKLALTPKNHFGNFSVPTLLPYPVPTSNPVIAPWHPMNAIMP